MQAGAGRCISGSTLQGCMSGQSGEGEQRCHLRVACCVLRVAVRSRNAACCVLRCCPAGLPDGDGVHREPFLSRAAAVPAPWPPSGAMCPGGGAHATTCACPTRRRSHLPSPASAWPCFFSPSARPSDEGCARRGDAQARPRRSQRQIRDVFLDLSWMERVLAWPAPWAEIQRPGAHAAELTVRRGRKKWPYDGGDCDEGAAHWDALRIAPFAPPKARHGKLVSRV